MTEQPKTKQEQHQEDTTAFYYDLLILFLHLKDVRLKLNDPKYMWDADKEDKRVALDEKLAKYQQKLEELKNS